MAQRPKAKPKSKGPKNTDKKQSERFIKAARKLGVDDKSKILEEVFLKIVSPIKAKQRDGT
jgi:hypothetical protein